MPRGAGSSSINSMLVLGTVTCCCLQAKPRSLWMSRKSIHSRERCGSLPPRLKDHQIISTSSQQQWTWNNEGHRHFMELPPSVSKHTIFAHQQYQRILGQQLSTSSGVSFPRWAISDPTNFSRDPPSETAPRGSHSHHSASETLS